MDLINAAFLVLSISACYFDSRWLLLVHGSPTMYNVSSFGAIGAGRKDDSQAFLKAWGALCGDTGSGGTPTLLVPTGKFLVFPVTFVGPCKFNNVHVRIVGNIIAPKSIEAWGGNTNSWLAFDNISGLIIDGQGSIDGQGAIWWPTKDSDRPPALHFHKCNNLQIRGLSSRDSPKNHISINECNGVMVSNVTLIAPKESPNTDGIDISESSQINIVHSTIATGDDCVAINGGSSNINITNVACGPGHGISVGSLGKDGKMETVEDVHVRGCSFTDTQNGARIKTWEGGSGYVRRVSFEDITLLAAQRPIIIDQKYCNGEHNCKPPKQSAVQITDITFKNFRGTSATQVAIALNCSEIMGCTNITLDHINITSSVPGDKLSATGQNVNGKSSFTNHSVTFLSSLKTTLRGGPKGRPPQAPSPKKNPNFKNQHINNKNLVKKNCSRSFSTTKNRHNKNIL